MTIDLCSDVIAANLLLVDAHNILGNTELRDFQLGRCKHLLQKADNHPWQHAQ
jgi:hypothetical protein